jgi:hypothetical protein
MDAWTHGLKRRGGEAEKLTVIQIVFDFVAGSCYGLSPRSYFKAVSNMARRQKEQILRHELRSQPEQGTRFSPAKNQGYQIPLPLWQDLVDEVARRKRLGLSHASQNAIAVAGITDWLLRHKGANE